MKWFVIGITNLFICNFKTHSFKNSKEIIQKVTIPPPHTHTSLIFETTKPKILKKIENKERHSNFTGKPK